MSIKFFIFIGILIKLIDLYTRNPKRIELLDIFILVVLALFLTAEE